MILNGYMNANGAAYWVERVQGSASSGQPSELVLQSLQEVACAVSKACLIFARRHLLDLGQLTVECQALNPMVTYDESKVQHVS
jgi:hypothetical protein